MNNKERNSNKKLIDSRRLRPDCRKFKRENSNEIDKLKKEINNTYKRKPNSRYSTKLSTNGWTNNLKKTKSKKNNFRKR